MSKLNYRPDVDGLRTIAVFLVILCHLSFPLFQGGFIGVDIFFVISGYLITKNIKKDLDLSRFSIANFYKKRIIRIAPAYFLILILSFLGGWLLLSPFEQVDLNKSIIASIFFVANIFFWKENGGYFSANSDETILLHLWSLSVEEQFYLIWPLICFLIYKIIKNEKIKTYLIVISTIILILVSEYITVRFTSASYYLPITRAFELLIGASIVFLPKIDVKKKLSDIIYLLCFLIFIGCTINYSSSTLFPGWSALIPCLATALIIYLNNSVSIYYKFLSTKTMVWFGKISYPMYLWHWLIISFINILGIEKNISNGILIILSTIILSKLTYEFLEKKVQDKFSNKSNTSVIFIGYILPALIISLICIIFIKNNGFQNNFSKKIVEAEVAIQQTPSTDRGKCHTSNILNYTKIEEIYSCILGDYKKQESSFLLIGDSHANHFTPMIDVFAKDLEIKGYDYTQDATAFLPNITWYRNSIPDLKFKKRNDDIVYFLEKNKFKYIILGGNFFQLFNSNDQNYVHNDGSKGEEAINKGMSDALNLIKENGAIPVVIIPIPGTKNSPKCIIRNELYNQDRKCISDIKMLYKNQEKFIAFLDKAKNIYPNLIIINPNKVVCNDSVCFDSLDDKPIYIDQGHLNSVGSRMIGEKYLKQFENPLNVD